MRVRDELKMTIAAYQTLYQSSVTFGMRKQLQSEQGKAELETKIEELMKKKAKLDEKVF
jgi:dynein light intermediate chain, axonemal